MKRLVFILTLLINSFYVWPQSNLFKTNPVVEYSAMSGDGWHLRALAGVREIHKKYGDDAIILCAFAIGHKYYTNTYDPFFEIHRNVPEVCINRSINCDTYPKEIFEAYEEELGKNNAEAEVQILNARYVDKNNQKIKISVSSRFAQSNNSADYRLAFVIIEDKLPSYGASYYPYSKDERLQGYDISEPTKTDYLVRHIDYYGIENSIPGIIESGQSYLFEYTLDLPSKIVNKDNISIVALLQNSDATRIYNANRCRKIEAYIPPVLPDCSSPTISFNEGKLVFTCDTEGATVVSKITCEDINTFYEKEIELSATYNISAYAKKEDYNNSETVTSQLCWIDKPNSTGIEQIQINKRPLIVSSKSGYITIQGLSEEENVDFYTLNGQYLTSKHASDGRINYNASQHIGDIIIIKIGSNSIKTQVK